MGTRTDIEVTDTLTVRYCLNGTGVVGGLIELYGVTGHEWDYVEGLTREQAKQLRDVLDDALGRVV